VPEWIFVMGAIGCPLAVENTGNGIYKIFGLTKKNGLIVFWMFGGLSAFFLGEWNGKAKDRRD
jgi:hypothetical protein